MALLRAFGSRGSIINDDLRSCFLAVPKRVFEGKGR